MAYNFNSLDRLFTSCIQNNELSGAIVFVRKDQEILFKKAFGCSDIEKQLPLDFDNVFEMMSMSKVVTAVGIMKLFDCGLLNLDDPLSMYIPEFKHMRVVCDRKYNFEGMTKFKLIWRFLTFDMKKVKTKEAEREITLRDLLSHSSGLEQGIVGLIQIKKNNFLRDSYETTVREYSKYPLDFNPKTGTSYSPLAGFDLLCRVIEVVSGKSAEEYFKEEVFDPLLMKHSTFRRKEVDQNKLAHLYKKTKNGLKDVTGSKDDMESLVKVGNGYVCGSGGLYSTLADYSNLTGMLVNDGVFHNRVFMKKETVNLMRSEGQTVHLEPDPGMVWGLGVKICQDPSKYKTNSSAGTYGWSGAFGTHFFISPEDKLEAIMLSQRSDAGGSGFYVAKEFERMVFEIIHENN